jgi:hypothetical protein
MVMSCCAARNDAGPQPAPASSNRAQVFSDFSLLALAVLTSVAPVAEVPPQFSPVLPPFMAVGVPLYERHCVWLI